MNFVMLFPRAMKLSLQASSYVLPANALLHGAEKTLLCRGAQKARALICSPAASLPERSATSERPFVLDSKF